MRHVTSGAGRGQNWVNESGGSHRGSTTRFRPSPSWQGCAAPAAAPAAVPAISHQWTYLGQTERRSASGVLVS